MREYDWPRNVHEMVSVISTSALLAGNSVIELADLPQTLQSPAPKRAMPARLELGDGFNLERAVEAFEWLYIEEALRRPGGNKTSGGEPPRHQAHHAGGEDAQAASLRGERPFVCRSLELCSEFFVAEALT
jgi:hypothetical protein